MEAKRILEITKNNGFEASTISGGSSQSQTVKFENGSFAEVKESFSEFATIITFKDGNRMSTVISRPNEEKIIEGLKDINELQEFKTMESPEEPLSPQGLEYVKPIKSKYEPLTIVEAKEVVKKLHKKVNETVDSIIKENTVVYYGVNASKSYKVNSKGMDLKTSKGEAFSFTVGAFARKGEDETQKYVSFIFKTKDEVDIDLMAKKIDHEVQRSLVKKEIEPGNYEIVLDKGIFVQLTYNFMNHFNARQVIDKISKYRESLGKQVASKLVTLIDAPILDEVGMYVTYDADGFPTKERKIIDEGILKTFIHNAKTARILNQENTGNSVGGGSRPFNLLMEPGTYTDEQIIGEVKEGLLITALKGFHSGVNNISGDFSLEISAIIIKNGKLANAIKTGVISGNYFEDVLNNVSEVSSETNYKFNEFNPIVKLAKKLPIATQ